eukprot:TRINITY_DN68201_c5_g4_i1.p1 TRINITY_DN68201_c5_g4~~TRINITY_DN68201_c5_g4_i1.p1  ORF type:complete len:148 (-),score=10.33 TRINITY_DN68201_c5_g4_i1:420-863(-)
MPRRKSTTNAPQNCYHSGFWAEMQHQALTTEQIDKLCDTWENDAPACDHSSRKAGNTHTGTSSKIRLTSGDKKWRYIRDIATPPRAREAVNVKPMRAYAQQPRSASKHWSRQHADQIESMQMVLYSLHAGVWRACTSIFFLMQLTAG